MSGTRIKMAKDSLILFLKSLPPNSYFNIISFGSSYAFMFPESKKFTEDTVEEALK